MAIMSAHHRRICGEFIPRGTHIAAEKSLAILLVLPVLTPVAHTLERCRFALLRVLAGHLAWISELVW